MLCSLDIMEAVDQENPLEKEMTREEDKFSAIHLLQTSDTFRYGNINKKLQNWPYVAGGNYLTTSRGDYEPMVYRSG